MLDIRTLQILSFLCSTARSSCSKNSQVKSATLFVFEPFHTCRVLVQYFIIIIIVGYPFVLCLKTKAPMPKMYALFRFALFTKHFILLIKTFRVVLLSVAFRLPLSPCRLPPHPSLPLCLCLRAQEMCSEERGGVGLSYKDRWSCCGFELSSVDTVFATVVATTVATLKDKSKVWGDF